MTGASIVIDGVLYISIFTLYRVPSALLEQVNRPIGSLITMNYSTYLASLGRIPILAVAAILTGSFVSYCLGLAVYRLYLSPIATFPGPKLAALTHWYEVYYDLFAKGTGGQFTWEIKRMHEKYGPIVRINPDELHIDDAEYWNDVYCSSTSSRPMDKPTKFKYRFGIPEATFSTTFAEQHRERRAALSPFFSKQHIRTLNDKLLEIIGHISHRLSTEYAGTGQVISISNMWSSMTSDIITDLAFSRSLNCSAAPEFKSPFSLAMQSLIWTAHWNAHFKFLVDVMDLIPEGILGFLAPSMKPILGYRVVSIARWSMSLVMERELGRSLSLHFTSWTSLPSKLVSKRNWRKLCPIPTSSSRGSSWSSGHICQPS